MKGFLSEPLERRQSVTNTTTCNRHNVERMVAQDQWTCALGTVADHTVVWGIHQVLTFTRAWPRKVCSSLWSSPLSHLDLSTGQGLERTCQNSWQFMRKATLYTMWRYSLLLGTWYWVLGTPWEGTPWYFYLALGTWYLVLGTWHTMRRYSLVHQSM